MKKKEFTQNTIAKLLTIIVLIAIYIGGVAFTFTEEG